jgi:hypothetical protein
VFLQRAARGIFDPAGGTRGAAARDQIGAAAIAVIALFLLQTASGAETVAPLLVTSTHTGNAVQGQSGFTCTISVQNTGNQVLSGVTLTDALPASIASLLAAGIPRHVRSGNRSSGGMRG